MLYKYVFLSLLVAACQPPEVDSNRSSRPTIKYRPGQKVTLEGDKLAVATIDTTKICSHMSFYDAQGNLVQGKAKCPNKQASGVAAADSDVCSRDGQTKCVATALFPATQKAGLAKKVLGGTTVAGIRGEAIGDDGVLCAQDGATSCIVAGSYAAAEASGLSSKIQSGQTLLGVAGTATLPAPGKVLSGVSYGSSSSPLSGTLTLPLASNVLAGSGIYGNPATALVPSYQPDFPDPAHVRAVDTVNQTAGTLADCSTDGQSNCMVVGPGFAAASTSGLASKLLSAQTLAGVSGNVTLPAENLVFLASAYGVGGNGKSGTLTLPAANKVLSGSGTYGNPSAPLTPSYSPDFPDPANVRSIDTVDGVGGTLADCSSDLGTGCVSIGTFRAADASRLSAGNIRSGVTIGGQAGDYPSATYTLPGASATADLDNAAFNAKIKASGSFEFWSSDGTRQVASGDADLIDVNVVSGVDIFGLAGQLPGPNCTYGSAGTCNADTACRWNGSSCEVNPWNLRVGISFSGSTGLVKTNCENRITSSIFNSDAMPPGNAVVTTGSAFDWWDTIDHYNNNAYALPASIVSGWGSDQTCGKELWSDMTADGACDSAADDCMIKDMVTGIIWSESYPISGQAAGTTATNWSTAVAFCDALNFGGATDWRLPTQFELYDAYQHGMRMLGYRATGAARPGGDTLENNNYFLADVSNNFWSATVFAGYADTTRAHSLSFNSGNANITFKTVSSPTIMCVRP